MPTASRVPSTVIASLELNFRITPASMLTVTPEGTSILQLTTYVPARIMLSPVIEPEHGVSATENANLSASSVADVPAGVVTVMSTVPCACAGLSAVILVLVSEVIVAAVPPKLILVAPSRFIPEMVTTAPPASDPAPGLIEVMDGVRSTLRTKDCFAGCPMPLVAVTVTGKVPDEPAFPDNIPDLESVMPLGSAPNFAIMGAGTPVALTVKDANTPKMNVALLADVITGATVFRVVTVTLAAFA